MGLKRSRHERAVDDDDLDVHADFISLEPQQTTRKAKKAKRSRENIDENNKAPASAGAEHEQLEQLNGSFDGEEHALNKEEKKLSSKERKKLLRKATKQERKESKKSRTNTEAEIHSAEHAPISDEHNGVAMPPADLPDENGLRKEGGPVQDKPRKKKNDESREDRASKRKRKEGRIASADDTSLPPGHRNEDTGTSQRFIVFVGNLPFSASKESIEQHFSAVAPFTTRLLTDKKTKKPKGCAFVEFEQYDKMKTCLKLYHHSIFEDDKKKSRKINVELTAGGGGKSQGRMEKIKEKNLKLKEERRRAHDKETQEKAQKLEPDEAFNSSEAPKADEHSGMHPSRRARLDL